MSRTVPAFVYWILQPLTGGLFFAGFLVAYRLPFPLVPTMEAIGAIYFVGGIIEVFADDRREARHEGRSPASLISLPGSRVALRPLPQGVRLAGEFAFDLGFNLLMLFAVAYCSGKRPVHLLPLGLPLFAAYSFVRPFVKKARPNSTRSIALGSRS